MPDQPLLFDIIYTTRAMRRLKPDPVPEDLLRRLVDAAHQAPSGSNAQNGRWLVVRDATQKAALAGPNLAAARGYASLAREGNEFFSLERRNRMVDAVMWQAEHLHEIPALIFACLEMATPPPDTFWSGAGAGGSIWPGVQNLLLAARGLGLGATPTSLIFSDRPRVKEILGLPAEIEPFCMIPVGYPLGNFGPVSRRPLEEVLRWDRWT